MAWHLLFVISMLSMFSTFCSAAEAIMQTSARHPLRKQQAQAIETVFGEKNVIESLERAGQLVSVEYDGQVYLLPSWFTRGVHAPWLQQCNAVLTRT